MIRRIIALVLILGLVAVPVFALTLENTSLQIQIGQIGRLKADAEVVWTSSDETIVKVDENGLVTGINGGNAIITATTWSGETVSAQVEVQQPVSSIAFEERSLTFYLDDGPKKIGVVFNPDNTTQRKLVWRSENPQICTVDENGVLTPIGVGSARIGVRAENGFTATALVNIRAGRSASGNAASTGVSQAVSTPVPMQSVQPQPTPIPQPTQTPEPEIPNITIYVEDGEYQADLGITSYKEWRSENEKIFTVSDTGVITPLAVGTARVGVRGMDNKITMAYVTVEYRDPSNIPIPVEAVSFENKEYTLFMDGGPQQLVAILTPDNTTQTKLEWRSENENIFTVDQSGVATPVSVGKSRVGVMCQNGEVAMATVYVKARATEITVSTNEVSLVAYEKTDVTANVYPEDATDRGVIWETSDSSVATVTKSGVIYGRGEGSCIITARASGGENVTAQISVTVSANPEIEPKYIALTFDDGPKASTLEVLEILEQYDITATFFMVGVKAKNKPEIAQAVANAGHEIGNHTYSHQNLKTSSRSDARRYIETADEVIEKVTGVMPTVLRAPGGSITAERARQIGGGRYFIYWTVDSRDWESQNANSIYKVTMRDVRDGAVLLYHDTQAATVSALPRILDSLVRNGYHFVTVSELMEYTGTGETMIYNPK